MKKLTSYGTLFALLFTPVASFGQPFFYRTQPNLSNLYEPRFERNWLSTWRLSVMGGGTSKGYQSKSAIGADGTVTPPPSSKDAHSKTDALNIYGWQNFQFLGANIVNNPGANIYNANLAVLDQLPTNGTFGYVQYAGKFSYVEADFYFAQNFKKGFFAELNIPVVHTKFNNVTFADQSATSGFPNNQDANWQFLIDPTNLAATLALYDLEAGDTSKTGVGDIELYVGWTMNKEDLCDSIDFLDTTIKVGINMPSGFKKDQNQAFSVAAGYDGNTGFPIQFDAAIGFFEWFTLEGHVGGTFFVNKTKNLRMVTSAQQNGFIKLGYGEAKRDLGNLFDAGAYLKADHVFKGFSFSIGYVYAHQAKTTLTATDTATYPTAIINTDSMLQKWVSQSLNGVIEYDFAKEGKRWNPVIGVFYSQPVAGVRIFNTKTGGGYAGVNVAWDF